MADLNDVAAVVWSRIWLCLYRNFDAESSTLWMSLVTYTLTDVATLSSSVTWIFTVTTWWNINLYFNGYRLLRDLCGHDQWTLIRDRDLAEGGWRRRAAERKRLMTQRGVYRSDIIDQLSPVRVTTSHWPFDLWPRQTSRPFYCPIVTHTLTGV